MRNNRKERAARAAGHILDVYGTRAEWARLKKDRALSEPDLQRARWYRVADFDSRTRMVTVDVDEKRVHGDFLVYLRSRAEKATVYSPEIYEASGWGDKPPSLMSYHATCPNGHDMGDVTPVVVPDLMLDEMSR